tara:strand:- start:8328 stop:8906 length:579 start_codon:yes stop_codon:yes gene_type:complete
LYKFFIPIKSFDQSKQRLTKVLRSAQRKNLSKNMFIGTVKILKKNKLQPIVVSNAREITEKEENSFFSKKNLNEALEDAIKTYAKKDEFIVIMHADLPLISNQDLDYLINLIHQQKTFVVPDRFASGTNAVGFKWRNQKLLFGKNSFNKFCSYFEKIGTDYIKVDLKNISFDLDTEDDLNLLTLDKLNKLIS